MFKYKIEVRLETQTDMKDFVGIATSIPESVYLEDGLHCRADAKSMMGVIYGKFEFKHLYVVSNYEHLETKFSKFLI